MSKNNENKLVPKLRFPEFLKSDDWQNIKIGDITQVSAGGTPESTNPEYWGGEIPWMNSGELNNKRIYSVSNYITKKGYDESSTKLIPPNCVLIGLAGQGKTRGTAAINYIELCTNQSIGAIHPNREVFESEFLYQKIDSLYEKLRKLSAGDGGRGGLNLQIIKAIEILLPSLKEQQKIAACLSSLDEVIKAESQKLDILKDHKKGLLQNLLPQAGETVPKFRFKEFEDSGEWVEKRLDEIADFLKGKGISKADVDDKGKQPCIRYGELYTHYGEVIKEIKSFTNLNEEDLMLSEPNDVIIPSSGETKEDIATASCVKLGGVALGGDLNILRSSLNGDFLAYYLSHGLKKAISKIAQGDAVVHLYATQLKKLIIRVPIKKKEQERIADMISSLDDIINIQNQKLEALQFHKKGLLQGLFPNVNEVTK